VHHHTLLTYLLTYFIYFIQQYNTACFIQLELATKWHWCRNKTKLVKQIIMTDNSVKYDSDTTMSVQCHNVLKCHLARNDMVNKSFNAQPSSSVFCVVSVGCWRPFVSASWLSWLSEPECSRISLRYNRIRYYICAYYSINGIRVFYFWRKASRFITRSDMLTDRLMVVLTQTVPLTQWLCVKLNSLISLNQNRARSDIVMSETIPTITVINYYYSKVIKLIKT
jgi:hypothetical protein